MADELKVVSRLVHSTVEPAFRDLQARAFTDWDDCFDTLEGGSGDLTRQVLYAIAAGRTKYNEIEQAVGTSPSRVIDNLIELRLLERIAPVTEGSKRTRRGDS